MLEQLSRTGYGHNFGEQAGGGPSVQGQLIVQILKPLLDKCVSTRKELQAHENIVSNVHYTVSQKVNQNVSKAVAATSTRCIQKLTKFVNALLGLLKNVFACCLSQ